MEAWIDILVPSSRLKPNWLYQNHKTSFEKYYFLYFSPWKGTLTLTSGMCVWGGHLGPPKSSQILKNQPNISKISKNKKKETIFFPPKGTLTLTPGMGGGEIPQISQKTKKYGKWIFKIYFILYYIFHILIYFIYLICMYSLYVCIHYMSDAYIH